MNFSQMRDQFLKDAKKRMKELEKKQSEYDTYIADAMHFLENEKYDAVAMVKIAKYLQTITRQRRKVKTEYEKLQSTTHAVTKGADKFDSKTYTYRTTTMQNICKKHYKIEDKIP